MRKSVIKEFMREHKDHGAESYAPIEDGCKITVAFCGFCQMNDDPCIAVHHEKLFFTKKSQEQWPNLVKEIVMKHIQNGINLDRTPECDLLHLLDNVNAACKRVRAEQAEHKRK